MQAMPGAMYVYDIPNDGDDLELGEEWADYDNKEVPEITYFNGREFSDMSQQNGFRPALMVI
jgi:hypothetical protein